MSALARIVPSDGVLVYRIVLLALGLYLTVSQALLTVLGIPYHAPTGNFIYKLHPGTYLLSVALAIALLRQGNPLTALMQRLRSMPWLAVYLSGMVGPFLYSLMRYGPSGSAFFIDTLMMPAVVSLLMVRFTPQQLRCTFTLMLVLVVCNAAVGLVEAIIQHHLIPYTISGGIAVVEDKFRATALLGHPLENALITGVMLLAALDMPMSATRRLAFIAPMVLALLAFGGRTSFLLSSIALLACGTFAISRKMLARQYSYLQLLGGSIGLLIGLPAVAGLVALSGLGERIFASLYFDDSASVRLRIFHVFDYLDGYDLLFGIAPTQISQVAVRIGLDPKFNAIENFWLFMLLQLGAIVFSLFVVGMASGLVWLWRRSGSGGRCTLIVFMLTASTTNSLVSKTGALTLLFAALCGLVGFRAAPSGRIDNCNPVSPER